MRSIARHLIDFEAQRKKSPQEGLSVIFPVTDKLRPLLATLTGNGGFRALLSRALALAGAEVPWLRALHVNADGVLEGGEGSYARIDPAESLEGKVVLLARLLELLVAFIGTSLTLRLLGEVWPQISFNAMGFGNGDDNEKKAK
jgi:hypothetical protein